MGAGVAQAQTSENYALKFDGSANVAVENAEDINLSSQNQRTIEAWFKVDDKSVADRRQIIWEEGGRTNGFNLYVYDDTLHVGAWSERNGWEGDWLETGDIQSGQWHHVALVFNADSGTMEGYLDGVEFESTSAPSPVNDHRAGIGIGAVRDNSKFEDAGQFSGSGEGFAGMIEEVRIWNRARSASSLREDRFRSLFGNKQDLVAYWRFNEGSGSTTADATYRRHEGTLNGPNWTTIELPRPSTPIFLSSPAPEVLVDSRYEYAVFVEDDGNISLQASSLPGWMSFTDEGQGQGTLEGTPTSSDEGTHSVVLEAVDGDGNSTRQSFEVTVTKNYALQFDGADDNVSVEDDRDINTADQKSRTIEAWFKADDTSVSDRKQVVWEEGGEEDGFNIYLYDGFLYVGAWGEENGWQGEWLRTGEVTNGQWHHVALVFDASEGRFEGYLDGIEFGSSTPGAPVGFHQDDIGIGALLKDGEFHDGDVTGSGPAHAFQGKIDEVRIWNVARSPSALRARQFDLLYGKEEGLVAYWPLNEGTGSTASDLTGRGHTGTVNGAAWQDAVRAEGGGLRISRSEECAANEVSFSWSRVPGADEYRLDVANRRDESAILDQVTVGDTASYSYDVSSLSEGQTYYGRVAASADGGATYDTTSGFTDGVLVDRTAPVPNQPTGRVEGENVIVFTASGSDNLRISQFHLQVADDQDFSDPVAETELAPGEAYEFQGTQGTTYYARARATDCAGNQSTYSNVSAGTTLEPLPDLTTKDVQAPTSAVAGNEITVEWTTENSGQGPTRSQGWKDAVFFVRESSDGTTERVRLGSVGNASFLAAGEEYRQQASFTVPLQRRNERTGETIVTKGSYDVVVEADRNEKEREATEDNNEGQASEQINVSLPPLPDLVVTEVRDPKPVCRATAITASVISTSSAVSVGSSAPDKASFLEYEPCGSSVRYVGNERRMSVGPNLGFTYSWEVTNQGEGPVEDSWRGSIFFQQGEGPFDPEKATPVASVRAPGGLRVGDTTSMVTPSPEPYPGDINEGHFYVVTNAEREVFEGVADTNNVFKEQTVTQLTPVPPSDLEPTAIAPPDSAVSGDSATVEWTVRNNGPNQVQAGVWQDRIYLSSDDTFDPEQDTTLERVYLESEYQNEVPPDTQFTVEETVSIPDGISGSYHLFVDVDATDRINEYVPDQGDFEDNNVTGSSAFEVELSDYPDLTVEAVGAPSEAEAGTSVLLEYEVQNDGPAATPQEGAWKDRVFLASSDTLDEDARSLTTIDAKAELSAQQSYRRSKNIRLPADLEEGNYYLHVKADAEGEIYEHGAAALNNTKSLQITVNPKPRPDLEVTSFSIEGTLVAGQPVKVNWRVENNGSSSTESASWLDRIYISPDSTVEASEDAQLGQKVHTGRLQVGDGYDASQTVGIPGDAEGERYLLLATDAGEEAAVQEIDAQNNRDLRGVTVSSGPQPDLRVDSVEVLGSPTAAQPLDVVVTVVNEGEALPASASWGDTWTFSEVPEPTESSERLQSATRSGPLAAGATYTDTITVEVPRYASGAYYLLSHTDSKDYLDEGPREANNRKATPVSVTRPPPSDLVVRDVQVPSSVRPGEEVSIQYELVNTGDNPAQGRMYDAVYLSEDQVLDTGDPRLTLQERPSIQVDPKASKTVTLTTRLPRLAKDQSSSTRQTNSEPVGYSAKDAEKATTGDVPGLVPGDYNAIVWTDVRNNIRETDDQNNRTVSSEQTTVTVPELTPGTPEPTSLASSEEQRYYKVDVSAEKDLRLSLENKTDEARDENFEVFVAHERAPTPSDFDAAFQAESNEQPRVLLPNTRAGSYYVMVRNPYLADSASAEVTAQTFDFSLFETTPEEGGNSGRVVATLTGAQLDTTTTFYLKNGSTRIDGDIVQVSSTMQVEVRFDLRGQPLGDYDIVAKKGGGAEARLEQAFTVATPVESKLQHSISAPSRLRIPRHRPVSFPVTVENGNNIDHDIVVLSIMVPGDERFSVRSDDFASALLFPEETDIPEDSLPAAGMPVYAEPSNTGSGRRMGMITMIAKDVRVGETLTAEVRSRNLGISIGEGLTLGVEATAYSEKEFKDLIRQRGKDVARRMRELAEADTSSAYGGAKQKAEYLSALSELLSRPNEELIDAYRRTGLFGDGPLTSLRGKPVYDPEKVGGSGAASKAVTRYCMKGGALTGGSLTSTTSSSLASSMKNGEDQTCSNLATAASVGLGVGSAVYSGGLLAGFAAGALTLTSSPVIVSISLAGSVVFTAITIDSALSGRDYGLTGDIAGVPTPTSLFDVGEEVLTHPAAMDFICSLIVGGFDPNDIVGPPGKGAAQWVQRDATLPYKIRFENDPERANAPARNVVIRQPLDQSLDTRTVRIRRFGFGRRTYEVSGSQGQVQRRVDVRDSLGVYVDFNAGVDAQTGDLFFSFRSIDPGTGRPPTDPSVGFLPPNDTASVGEGFVEYTVEPQDTTSSGAEITAQAEIVFDQNPAIETPEVFNTVDADTPESHILDDRVSFLNSGSVEVNWQGTDPMPGSGTQSYALYVAPQGGSFRPLATGLTDTTYVFDPDTSSADTYRFFTLAKDEVGNQEPLKSNADATISLFTPTGVTATASGETVELSWQPPDVSGVARYRIYRARGPIQEETSSLSPVDSVAAGATTYTDGAAEPGYTHHYRVTSVDSSGEESRLSSQARAFLYPKTVSTDIHRSFGGAEQAADYRLVALPGDADRSIGDVTSGQSGAQWQAFWDDGSDQDYLFEYDGTDTFNFRPGRGFWLTSTEDWSVERQLPTVELKGDSAAAIPLHPGWNIVSNPTDKPVPFADIQAAHADTIQALWAFNGTFSVADTMRSAAEGTAYYLLNDGGLDSLRIPYPGAPTEKRASVEEEPQHPSLRVIARPTGQKNGPRSAVRITIDPAASDTLDALDQVAPPGRFELLSLRLRTPGKVPSKRWEQLGAERRPPEADEKGGHTFDMHFTSELSGPIQIETQGLSTLDGREAGLLHPAAGKTFDLREKDEPIVLNPDGASTTLRLSLGTEAYVEKREDQVVPEKLTLVNYPNPFSDQTTFEYTLPEESNVRLALYDILGRRVATLENTKKEAGRYRLQLGAEDLASGVYFGRLKAGDQTRTKKITVVR